MTKTGVGESSSSLKTSISSDKTIIIKTKYELLSAKHFRRKIRLIKLTCT